MHFYLLSIYGLPLRCLYTILIHIIQNKNFICYVIFILIERNFYIFISDIINTYIVLNTIIPIYRLSAF